LALLKAYYGPGLYSRFFRFSSIPRIYGEIFVTDRQFGFGMGAVAVCGVLGRVLTQAQTTETSQGKAKELAEATLLLVFVLMPFLGYLLLVRLAHGGLEARYVVSAALGVALSIGYILSGVSLRAVAVFGAFVLSAVGVHELHFWGTARIDIEDVRSTARATEKMLESIGRKELRIVIPDGMLMLPLSHYISPSFSNRISFVIREPLPGDRDDTEIKEFLALKDYLPFPVSNFKTFTSQHRQFLIYVEQRSWRGEPDWAGDWLTARLGRDGWSLQNLSSEEYRNVYLATANDGKPDAK
jgi:cytochrome b561